MKLIYNIFLISIFFCTLTSFAQHKKTKVLITYPGETFELVGELGFQLGTVLTVEGLIFEGYYHEPNLLVQKIEDSIIQNIIKIPLTPYWWSPDGFSEKNEPNIKSGETYSLRVYETGSFSGIPDQAYEEANIGIKKTGYHFKNKLIVISGIKLKPISYNPADFIGRKGLFIGKAKKRGNVSFIFGKDWKIELPQEFKWDSIDLNKEVEIYGIVEPTDQSDLFRIVDSKPRLVNLEDQLGKHVKLRGMARSMNGYWWFNYRGIDLYVEDMENLPNWSVDNHWRTMEISGILMQEKKPDINQITIKTNPDLKTYFIIKNANWIPINELIVPEVIEELMVKW